MKTHILIPIKDIESKIDYYRFTIKRCEELNLKSHEYYRIQGFLNTYEAILAEYKQISLDDNIAEKNGRNFYWERNSDKFIAENCRPDIVIGYVEAIRDIIK